MSCKKFVEVSPPNSRIVSDVVFSKDETAIAAVEGMYQRMFDISAFSSGSEESFTTMAGLSADEFTAYSVLNTSSLEFYVNEINAINPRVLSLWSSAYNTIYLANSVLEGLARSTGVKEETRKQLEGEAKFVRAFTHFYLVNLYGDVPLILTTAYNENTLASRTPSNKVYEQIILDLTDARNLMSDQYISGERTRPNKFAASALLARVHLYLGDWSDAESFASEVINQSSTYNLPDDLNTVFLANSDEAIWQIEPQGQGCTWEGNISLLTADPVSFSLGNDLINAFEPNDNRYADWVGIFNGTETFYYSNKYKIGSLTAPTTEYSMVMRLAEQFLIRAEARAQQNNLIGANSAEADINKIRHRAGLPNTTSIAKDDLLNDVMKERRLEFFAEWGHRWLDLKRTGKADNVLSVVKSEWQPTDKLYPIPDHEIKNDPNLKPQNLGY